MSSYEFQVVPAPERVRKLTDLKKDQDKFCATVTDVLTDMGLAGWEFVGAETLPFQQRRMLMFPRVADKTCLVFRREIKPKVEPKRVTASTPETIEVREAEPEREAHEEVIAEFKSRRSRPVVTPQRPTSSIERIPTRRKRAPLRLENPIEDGTIIPIKMGHSKDARAALEALERAISTQER